MSKYYLKLFFLIIFLMIPTLGQGYGEPIARIESFKNEVQIRAKNTISWEDASSDMELFKDDRVRTSSSSTAKIAYFEPSGSQIEMNEKSMIIIRNVILIKNVKQREIELSEGFVKGVVKGDSNGDEVLRINTPPATLEIDTRNIAKKTANVDINVSPDKKTRVLVNKGMAKIESKGKTYELYQDEEGLFSMDEEPVIQRSRNGLSFKYQNVVPFLLVGIFIIISFFVYKKMLNKV